MTQVTQITSIIVWDLTTSQRWRLSPDRAGVENALSIITQLTRAARKYKIEFEGKTDGENDSGERQATTFISGKDVGLLYYGKLKFQDILERTSWTVGDEKSPDEADD